SGQPVSASRLSVGIFQLEHAVVAPVESRTGRQLRETPALSAGALAFDRAGEAHDPFPEVVPRRGGREDRRALSEPYRLRRLQSSLRGMEDHLLRLRDGAGLVGPAHVAAKSRLPRALV